MTFSRKKLGSFGEDKAKEFLENKGLIFLAKNLKLKIGEIDLLMQDKSDLVLVEVKTKSSDLFGSASDMITLKKKRKLLQLARSLQQKFPSQNIRIDVITIDRDNLEHHVSAVEEDLL